MLLGALGFRGRAEITDLSRLRHRAELPQLAAGACVVRAADLPDLFFGVSVAFVDLIALAIALVGASQVVFAVPFAWDVAPVWPLVGFMATSMVVMSFLTDQMSGPGVPRPTYGRMAVIGRHLS